MNELQNLIDAIKQFTDVDDETFTDDMLKSVLDNIEQQYSPEVINQSVNQIIQNCEDQGLTKVEATAAINALAETMKEMIYGEVQLVGNKKILVDRIMDKTLSIFEAAINKYHSYAIELPMTVDTGAGAKVPTYAHGTDAAADIYAMEDITLQGNTKGNMIRTGIRIQLPESWLAMILPRSSMGAKTPLRLSNSVGLIDSGYRGELGVLYDNTSDEPYEIKAGDRIAQLLVMPSYRFQAKVVDILADSDRGETGFGDSGK